MTVLSDRIAEVLDDHRPWTTWGLTDDGIYCGGCERRYTAFTAHVAERIEAELKAELDELAYLRNYRDSAAVYVSKSKLAACLEVQQ